MADGNQIHALGLERVSSKVINAEVTPLNTASTRCKILRKPFGSKDSVLHHHDALDTENCQIVTQMSADRLHETRLQLSRELKRLGGKDT
jgi:hypothetical protein